MNNCPLHGGSLFIGHCPTCYPETKTTKDALAERLKEAEGENERLREALGKIADRTESRGFYIERQVKFGGDIVRQYEHVAREALTMKEKISRSID